jgi:hypothetical protein
MRKEMTTHAFVDRAKAMVYMMLFSAIAYILFAIIFFSLNQ